MKHIIFYIATLVTIVLCEEYDTCSSKNFFKGPVELPSYIGRCSVANPNPGFSQCITSRGRDAIPRLKNGDEKYGFPRLYPFYTYDSSIDLISNATSKFKLHKNVRFYNLYKNNATNITFELSTLEVSSCAMTNDEFVIKGDFGIDGKFCGRNNVSAEGELEIKFKNFYVNYLPIVELQLRQNYSWVFLINNRTFVTSEKVSFKFECVESDRSFLQKCFDDNNSFISILKSRVADALGEFFTCYINTCVTQSPLWAIFYKVLDYPGP